MRHTATILALALCAVPLAALAEDVEFIPEAPVAETATPVELQGADEPEATVDDAPAAAPVRSRQASRAQGFSTRSEDDLVLVDIRAGRTTLQESVPGYANKNALVLPLGQLTEALQFPIKVRPREGMAEGWFLDRANSFSLDLLRHEAIIAGSRQSYDPALVELHEDDIYVDVSLLSRWFPLDFIFSFSSQSVEVKPRGKVLLPFQSEEQREKQRSRMGRGRDDDTTPLPRAEAPYQLYSLPFSDVTYTSGYDQRNTIGMRNELSVLANGDALYMQSSLYATANERDKISDLRWSLSRRDPDGKLFKDSKDDPLANNVMADTLNRIGTREIAVGDIYTQQLPLTAFNQQGRGLLISTKPYDQATQFDRTTLQGDLPTGWEVELYRNDELLNFQRASSNGRYEFIDVPLLSGLNIIRLVFYGPFGQTREEVQRFLVSPNITTAGKSYFRMSVSQQDTSIFDVRKELSVSPNGATPSERDMTKGRDRVLMEYEYGLAQNLALFSSVAHLTTGDGVARNYATGGVATSLLGVYGRVDASQELESKGRALQFSLQDNLYGVSLSAQHQQFYDFLSEFTESIDDPVAARTDVRADTPLSASFLPRMNVGLTGNRTLYDSGRLRHEIGQRLSTSVSRLAVSHTLALRRETLADSESLRETRGEWVLSMPWRDWLLRSNMSYVITPARSLDAVALTSEYHFSRDTLARVDVSRQIANNSLTTYTGGLNRKFRRFSLGANISHASDGNNAMGFTVSFSGGEDPRNGKLTTYPDYAARDGLVMARAYHDKNGNHVFDEGDEVLEDARFKVNRGIGASAEKKGVALLRNIPANAPARVTLDTSSIDSPYLVAPVPGAEVVARPGVPVAVDIALVSTTDVEGMAYIASGKNTRTEAANVMIQALDKDGKVVRETRSAYDGYYLLEGLPVGEYTVRVSPEQAERLGFSGTEEHRLVIDGSQESISHLDIVVKR